MWHREFIFWFWLVGWGLFVVVWLGFVVGFWFWVFLGFGLFFLLSLLLGLVWVLVFFLHFASGSGCDKRNCASGNFYILSAIM